jgi:hypothetical protein
VNVAFVGYNLIGDDEDQFPRGLGTGLAIYPSPKLMLSVDGRWNLENDTGRYGGGAELFLAPSQAQHGYPIRVGYVYDELGSKHYVTGGLGYVTPKVALDVGVRKQVSDGDSSELMLQFGLRLFMPN